MLNRSYTVSTRPRVPYRRVQCFRNLGDTFPNRTEAICTVQIEVGSMRASAVSLVHDRAVACCVLAREVSDMREIPFRCVHAVLVCTRMHNICASTLYLSRGLHVFELTYLRASVPRGTQAEFKVGQSAHARHVGTSTSQFMFSIMFCKSCFRSNVHQQE